MRQGDEQKHTRAPHQPNGEEDMFSPVFHGSYPLLRLVIAFIFRARTHSDGPISVGPHEKDCKPEQAVEKLLNLVRRFLLATVHPTDYSTRSGECVRSWQTVQS